MINRLDGIGEYYFHQPSNLYNLMEIPLDGEKEIIDALFSLSKLLKHAAG